MSASSFVPQTPGSFAIVAEGDSSSDQNFVKGLACPVCKRVFAAATSLKYHMNTVHLIAMDESSAQPPAAKVQRLDTGVQALHDDPQLVEVEKFLCDPHTSRYKLAFLEPRTRVPFPGTNIFGAPSNQNLYYQVQTVLAANPMYTHYK